MGLFNSKKKKEDDLDRLSEKEIQKKLYGEFNNSAKSVIVSEVPPFKEPAQPVDDGKHVHVGTLDSLEVTTPKQDLFEVVEEEKEEPEFQEPAANKPLEGSPVPKIQPVSEDPVKDDKLSFEPPVIPVPQEKKHYSSLPHFKTTHQLKPTVEKKKIKLPKISIPFDKIGAVLLGGLGTVVSVMITGIKVTSDLVYRHRQTIKKVAFWALGAALVFVLFSSVHYLNERREKAMSGTHTSVADMESSVKDKEVSKTPRKTSESRVLSSATPSTTPSTNTRTVEVTSPTEALSTVPAASEGRFVIQIATYVNENDANRVVESFGQLPWKAFVKGVPRSGGRIYYSVYLGRYQTFREAQTAFNGFKNDESSSRFQDAFIRTLKD